MVASCRRPGSDARTGFVPTAPAGRGDGTPPAGKEGGALSGYHSAVAIPALNPSETLPAYVDDLLEWGIPAVVVVNDGSAPDRQEIFDALARREGCVVLVHETNQGKGQAIKTACRYVLDAESCRALRGVVTADADGQHAAEDVCAIATLLDRGEEGLVLGTRDLRSDNVPTRSKIGNRLTSFAFHLLYGAKLSDTQTGLRGIPRELLPWALQVKGERFEYEMNQLISAVHDHIAYRQITIQTIYFDNNSGTHLSTFRDSWRIFRILMSGLGRYTLAAALSAVVDVAGFFLCYRFLFASLPLALCYLWSALASRGLSSALNYTLNRRYVFRGSGQVRRRAVLRYYCLWAVQLGTSYGLLMAASSLLPAVPAVLLKAVIDILLAIVSYQVQLRWVFHQEEPV